VVEKRKELLELVLDEEGTLRTVRDIGPERIVGKEVSATPIEDGLVIHTMTYSEALLGVPGVDYRISKSIVSESPEEADAFRRGKYQADPDSNSVRIPVQYYKLH